jgi:hypothetical protein
MHSRSQLGVQAVSHAWVSQRHHRMSASATAFAESGHPGAIEPAVCEVFIWFLGDGQRNGRFVREAPGMHHLHLAVKATPIVDARKGRDDE